MYEVLLEVLMEVRRAHKLHPEWPEDPLHALAILGEEFGELTQAVLQVSYDEDKATPEDVKKEAIQTAAMAIRFLLSIDLYYYQRSDQHEQLATD